MSCVKRKKRRSLADVVLFRKEMIRYWRNYDFYKPTDLYRPRFRHDYETDCFYFYLCHWSLRSYLAKLDKIKKLISNYFNQDISCIRKDYLDRIKKLKKRGKAKLLRGHLFDDEN